MYKVWWLKLGLVCHLQWRIGKKNYHRWLQLPRAGVRSVNLDIIVTGAGKYTYFHKYRVSLSCSILVKENTVAPAEAHLENHPGNACKTTTELRPLTVNTLMFARDLFGGIRDHLYIAKINTCKYNSCT